MRVSLPFVLLFCLTGCGFSSGIIPVGANTYTVSEERAPALGGGHAANRLVLTEATSFCLRQDRVSSILDLRPDGDPFTPYYPTAFDLTFQCLTKAQAETADQPSAAR